MKWKTYGGISACSNYSDLRSRFKTLSKQCHQSYISNTEKLFDLTLKDFGRMHRHFINQMDILQLCHPPKASPLTRTKYVNCSESSSS